MKVAEVLRDAARRLEAVSDTARLDAELLMAHTLRVSRSDLLLRHMQADALPNFASFEHFVERRLRHEPIAYIVGQQEFFGRIFAVMPGVLIPRADSETTVQAALEAAPAKSRVLDCGTGSGALILTFLAERPDASGIGIDASNEAVMVAAANTAPLGLAGRVQFMRRDWTQAGWADDLGAFDLILTNPPYVEDNADLDPDVRDFEPPEALFAGPEGLDDYRVLIPQLPELLKEGGVAVLEIGHLQGRAVAEIAAEHGFAAQVSKDLAGRDRTITLRLN